MDKFKLLKRYQIKHVGTTYEYIESVICPRCKEEFTRCITSGCFSDVIIPETCPKCNYPLKSLLNNIQLEDEEINPSER